MATPEPTWAELLGSKNWDGLLEPLDLSLRRLILRCGDFCQATYDAFNNDPHSKYAGSSRYGKSSFFDKVMLDNGSDYAVTCFLYATAQVDAPRSLLLHSLSREKWDRETNWIGYIATTTDEVSKVLGRREIYVAWRGTSRNYEWINVFDPELASAELLLLPENSNGDISRKTKQAQTLEPSAKTSLRKTGPDQNHFWTSAITSLACLCNRSDSDNEDENIAKVMKGWLTIYTSNDPDSPFTKLSAQDQLRAKIKQLVDKYKDENLGITFSGHSLGASLSIISAFDLVENRIVDSDIPVSAFVFGSPQIGNKAFNDRLEQFTNLKILHIRNKIDLIPLYPSGILGYVNSGVELFIDTRKSTSLKDSNNPGDWHNLQGMLHIVAGWNGEDGEFEMKVKRSVALVNKSSEFLKEEMLVPGSWWVEKNKGMVIDENGEWVLADPDDEDLPVPEF
ncbi:hypothetical protein LguiB_029638 [Lonicera macranthoides]